MYRRVLLSKSLNSSVNESLPSRAGLNNLIFHFGFSIILLNPKLDHEILQRHFLPFMLQVIFIFLPCMREHLNTMSNLEASIAPWQWV